MWEMRIKGPEFFLIIFLYFSILSACKALEFWVMTQFRTNRGLNLRYLTKEDVINSVLEVVDDSIELRYNSS